MDSDVEVSPREHVNFSYTNHQGKHAVRRVVPLSIYFGSSQWHHKEQWLLRAYDLDKKAERSFAMNDVTDWRSIEGVNT